MLKKLLPSVIIILLIFSLSGCSGIGGGQKKVEGAASTSAEGATTTKALSSVDKIKQAGKIIMGTSADFPPYENHEVVEGKDKIVGFDVDIAQAVADKLGVKLEITDMKFDGLIAAVEQGKIDFVAAGMTPTEERKKSVDFSQVYYNAEQVLVVKDDNNTINTTADMNGKKIGAQLGSTSEKAAQDVKGIKYKAMDKVDQLMLEVKSERLDGIVVENTVAQAYIKKISGLKIVKIDELNSEPGGSAMAVKKGDADLVKVIDGVIDELKSSGKYDELINKWFK